MSVTTLEVQTYPHLPPEIAQVHIGLLKNVKNAAQIRSRIISASTVTGETGDAEREAVNFAFIDARTVRGIMSYEAGYIANPVSHCVANRTRASFDGNIRRPCRCESFGPHHQNGPLRQALRDLMGFEP